MRVEQSQFEQFTPTQICEMATETKFFKDRHCEADKLKPPND
jgi:hypothetical protein